MPTITTGAIIAAAWDGRLDGQQILLTNNYKLTTVLGGPVDMRMALDEIAASFDILGEINATIASAYSQDVNNITLTLQVIHPVRYVLIRYTTVNDTGTVAEVALPPNVAHGITLRSDTTGPHARGTKHFGGVPPSFSEGGLLTPAGLTALDLVATELAQQVAFTADAVDCLIDPIIYNRSNPAASVEVTNYGIGRTTRVERRRTVGLGS